MPLNLEYKVADFQIKEDGDKHYIEGYASVFGVEDYHNDIVMPGAFKKSLRSRPDIKMLYQHIWRDVVGMWDSAKEDEKGLFVRGPILDTTLGNDVYKMVKAKAISKMSIGYTPVKWEMDEKKNVRKLLEVELWEVSLVTFPANEDAVITAVKSDGISARIVEDALCDAGFSRGDAKKIALHGTKALDGDQREVEAALAGINKTFSTLNLITKG